MKPLRGGFSATVLTLALIFGGCSTATPHYYTLDATAVPDGAAPARGVVLVGPVTVPPTVDQPQFVTDAGGNQVHIDEFNRWADPLSDNIARVVAQNLSKLLGTPDVTTSPMPDLVPNYLVAIQVQKFQSVPGQGTMLEALWTINDVPNKVTRSGHTMASETVQDDSFSALAAAHSRALAKLSDDIAGAVRLLAVN